MPAAPPGSQASRSRETQRGRALHAGACNKSKCVTHEIGVTGFERRRNIGYLTLLGVEIVGGIKSRCLDHRYVSASF